MHRRCCWPSRECQRRVVQPVFHLVPDCRGFEALLDAAAQLRPARRQAVDAQSIGDVLEDRLREGVRLLEHHSNPTPQRHDVSPAPIHVVTIDQHAALDPCAGDDVVHPVERAQKRALPAARRPDEGRHQLGGDADADVLQSALRPVIEAEVLDVYAHRVVGCDGSGSAGVDREGWGRLYRVHASPPTLSAGSFQLVSPK